MIRTRCAVCKQCWMLPIGVCIYGGPFTGYERIEENRMCTPVHGPKLDPKWIESILRPKKGAPATSVPQVPATDKPE